MARVRTEVEVNETCDPQTEVSGVERFTTFSTNTVTIKNVIWRRNVYEKRICGCNKCDKCSGR